MHTKFAFAVAVFLCMVDASASQYCPPLKDGQTPAIDSEEAAVAATREAFVSALAEEGYRKHAPYHASLHGETWNVVPETSVDDGIGAVTVCRSNGWLGYLRSVID